MNSVLGTILDPAADKILMTTLTVTLAMQSLLPRMSSSEFGPRNILTLRYSSSSRHHHWSGCIIELVSVLYSLYVLTTTRTFPPNNFHHVYLSMLQKTFKRYWDFSIPSAEVHPTYISKVRPLIFVE